MNRKLFRNDQLYSVLLSLTILVLVGFAFPAQLRAVTYGSYSLIAILLTRLLGGDGRLRPSDKLYRALGVMALLSLWGWLITPIKLASSGIPLTLSWSLLLGWSVLRLIKKLAHEEQVTSSVLTGAAAGYLHIGITAGLIMGAVETIQPGSFQPLLSDGNVQSFDMSVISTPETFSKINYFAFVCLTTLGFGDISPHLPLARMLSVTTGIIGPLYLAVVMGVLIGRFSGETLNRQMSNSEEQDHDHN